ncbi:MAG: hypothetical protein MUE73_07270 [Planctomycetes bacterium]|jgi:hypothetical protein|nr:hypothetical protein [Planctomycetota bacterium]
MLATGLAGVCGLAFLVVFGLLAFFALAIRLVMEAFPERPSGPDPARAAAIAAAVASVLPGARVTRIEEMP